MWVTGIERFPTGRPPTASERARTKTLSRASVTRLRTRCGSFTGNRVSHAPFFVTKRKAAAGWPAGERLAKSDWSCVGLPELLGYPVTVPRPTSVPQYTCRYSLAEHSHLAQQVCRRARHFFRLGRGIAREMKLFRVRAAAADGTPVT